MIRAALELTPAAAHHAHHVGFREIAPVIIIACALLFVLPMILDSRAAARCRERADREDA